MKHSQTRREVTAAGAALIASVAIGGARGARAAAQASDNPDASEIWRKVRASLFENRPIANAGDDALLLDAPVRAEDAAVVPIAMRARLPHTASSYVEKLYLVIDNNPSPIAAILSFTPQSGRAEVETRVRVDEYTFVRAIAETHDGRLLMRTRFVKASGGCSAPPGKDPQAALATLGKIKLRVDGDVVINKPTLVQLMISHPNDSGLAMNQLTRQFTPRWFVRTVNVAYGGQSVLSADLDFAISENPNLRFYFVPRGPGQLTVDVVDSNQMAWKSSLDVAPVA
ncbi:MAG TPA: quinoprotein dehydrogenase-associated SoxYZ-like carrier [Burkholderiaceae bacterium]|nr:quinoprotein dehydrogenase-associated SoxYZ-like carrier [Burkholderiaceae bacterium]